VEQAKSPSGAKQATSSQTSKWGFIAGLGA